MNNFFGSKLIIEDEEYYYFFRSLNAGDREDVASGITTAQNDEGKLILDNQGRPIISRIRTDRQRIEDKRENWNEEPRYRLIGEELDTLEEVYDHIKMLQRKDTNCVSLSANANVTFTYYANENPQYVVVKTRKDDTNVFNAAEYMMTAITDRLEMMIESINNPAVLNLLQRIKDAKSYDEVIRIIREHDDYMNTIKRENEYGEFYRRFDMSAFRKIAYLNDEQNLVIVKQIACIEVLREHELLGELIDNRDGTLSSLLATIKSAISSSEYIYYGEISGDNIERISRENLQAIAILQQYKDMRPENGTQVDEIIAFLLEKNRKGENIIGPLSGHDEIRELSIEEMYEFTNGNIPYVEARRQTEAFINISRARSDAGKIISQLEQEFGENDIFEEMKRVCVLPNPDLLHKQNATGRRVCESVYLTSDLKPRQLNVVVDEVQDLSTAELEEMATGKRIRTLSSTRYLPVRDRVLQKWNGTAINKYYTEAIYDSYNWTGLGRVLSTREKNKIIRAILTPDYTPQKGNSIERLYKAFQEEGFTPEEIPGIIINIAVNKQLGEVSYLNLLISENPRELIRANLEYVSTVVSNIDIELLLGKNRLVVQELSKMGVRRDFIDSTSEDARNLHSMYWAKRIVEEIDWDAEIGRKLKPEEKAGFIDFILDYEKTKKIGKLSCLYKNLMVAGLTKEEAARFIVIGSIDNCYPLSNLMGYRERVRKFVTQDLEYHQNRRIQQWDMDKARIIRLTEQDKDGKDIRARLIKLGFDSKYMEKQRTDNLYLTEYLVDNMKFSRPLSTEEKIALMEQILDSVLLSNKGNCRLITTCQTIRDEFNIPVDKIASLLVNISINGVKTGFGYKRLISTQEIWKQLKQEELDVAINENTILETRIQKQFRAHPEEREFYEQQLLDLGIELEKVQGASIKDLCWALGLFNSIDFQKRLGRELHPNERKVILECLLSRPTDGSTIQGLFEKLNNLKVKNIAEVLVNAALGYSGVYGLNYSQNVGQDELKKALEGNYDKINTQITEEILAKKLNEQQAVQDDYLEELKRIGVRPDFLEPGNPNEKKPKNVYWINKIVDDYDWEQFLGRPITASEKAILVEKLLFPTIMNANMEAYIGNTINYMYEKGVESKKICGYIIRLALYSSKIKGVNYTSLFGNRNIADLFLANLASHDFVIDEACLKKAELEVQMDRDIDGRMIYERMRQLGVRADFLDEGSPRRRTYKPFYFVERIMREYDFKGRFGRELTREEQVAIIERMMDIEKFSEEKGTSRPDTTFDVIRTLDLKGKDPLGVMLFIGFERIDLSKVKDQKMYYANILHSEPTLRKIEYYIEYIGDTITEPTLRAEVIRSKMNRPAEVEALYSYYQTLRVNPEFTTKGGQREKSLGNLFMAKKILDDYDFQASLGRKLDSEEERLILEAILDNNWYNESLRISIHRLYNNIEMLGLDRQQIAGLFINLTMSKRRGTTYSQLAKDQNSTGKLNAIRDELKFDVDEQTLEDLRKAREAKDKARKVARKSVDPRRNDAGRGALADLVAEKEGEKDGGPNSEQ